MAVLSLILGILSLVVFCWLGPTIGGLTGAPSMEQMMSGNAEFSTGAVWGWGIAIGVILPLLAVVFGIMGVKTKKGLALAGIIMGAIGAIVGIVITWTTATGLGAAGDLATQGMQGMQNPDFQQQLQQGLDQAAQQGVGEAMQQAQEAAQQAQEAAQQAE